MFRLTIVYLIAVSLLGISVDYAAARGRSFPIEITGSIVNFDRANQAFTIQVDEPARILTIAIGRDCKFKKYGASTAEQILRRGARVKVRYFATILTGNIAVEIELNPIPQIKRGIVEKIERRDRKLTLRLGDESCHLVVRWAANARFVKRDRTASATDLRRDMPVKVSYFSPAFETNYAVKIEIERDR